MVWLIETVKDGMWRSPDGDSHEQRFSDVSNQLSSQLIFHPVLNGHLHLLRKVRMLLRYLTQPSAVVKALTSGICLQVLQGNLVDVVVSVEGPEPITPTPHPVEESSEVRHRTLDQILK